MQYRGEWAAGFAVYKKRSKLLDYEQNHIGMSKLA